MNLLNLNTQRGTKTTFLTLERYVEHSNHFFMGVSPPPPLPRDMQTQGCFIAYLVINILFIATVKYTVKVYTPDSHARTNAILTIKIEGQGEQKTADHVLYETTQDTERFDICSFLCSS